LSVLRGAVLPQPAAPSRRCVAALAKKAKKARRKQNASSTVDLDSALPPPIAPSLRDEPASTSAPVPGSAPSTSGRKEKWVPEGREEPAGQPAPPPSEEPLVVGRGRIFVSCASTAGIMTLVGAVLRRLAEEAGPSVHGYSADVIREVASVPQPFPPEHYAVALGVAAAVTAARVAALGASDSYRAATERSLTQVLGPLGWLDLAWVSFLPALSEEILFRGALVPAVSPDWRGVGVSAVVFGALHVTGNRNGTSAAFAGVAGAAYGAAMLATHNVAVPVVAHFAANLASAALWKSKQGGGGQPDI